MGGSKFYGVNMYGQQPILVGCLWILLQDNLEIWSALGAILSLFYAYLGLVVK